MKIRHRNQNGSAPFSVIKSAISNFAKDESAAVTVEFVLWVPVFVLILAITVDASVLFMTQANLWSIARDTTRKMSTKTLTVANAPSYARQRMPAWRADTTINASSTANTVSISFSVPVAKVSPFNIVSAFTTGTIDVVLDHQLEPR